MEQWINVKKWIWIVSQLAATDTKKAKIKEIKLTQSSGVNIVFDM